MPSPREPRDVDPVLGDLLGAKPVHRKTPEQTNATFKEPSDGGQ